MLLQKSEQLTLDEAIDIARTYEATQSQMEEFDGESDKDIHGFKGDANESKNKATVDWIILYSPEGSALYMDLCA